MALCQQGATRKGGLLLSISERSLLTHICKELSFGKHISFISMVCTSIFLLIFHWIAPISKPSRQTKPRHIKKQFVWLVKKQKQTPQSQSEEHRKTRSTAV